MPYWPTFNEKKMKKYVLILLATWCSITTFAQTTTEKIKFSVRDNDSEYSIRSSFPAERAERMHAIITRILGEATQSTANESLWVTSVYSSRFAPNRFEATLHKSKATNHQIDLFKELTAKLQEALDQPKPPKQPQP